MLPHRDVVLMWLEAKMPTKVPTCCHVLFTQLCFIRLLFTQLCFITISTRRKLGIIARVFNKYNRQVKCNLYKQIILSKLDYCSNVWDPQCIGHIKFWKQLKKEQHEWPLENGTWTTSLF